MARVRPSCQIAFLIYCREMTFDVSFPVSDCLTRYWRSPDQNTAIDELRFFFIRQLTPIYVLGNSNVPFQSFSLDRPTDRYIYIYIYIYACSGGWNDSYKMAIMKIRNWKKYLIHQHSQWFVFWILDAVKGWITVEEYWLFPINELTYR